MLATGRGPKFRHTERKSKWPGVVARPLIVLFGVSERATTSGQV